MLFFIGLIFLTYFSLFRNFSLFNESLLPFNTCEFKFDRIRNTKSILNRAIIFSLSKRDGELQYIFYARKLIKVLAVLFIPWFVLVYFMEWYNCAAFVVGQFIVSVFVVRTPSLIFTFILDAWSFRCKN